MGVGWCEGRDLGVECGAAGQQIVAPGAKAHKNLYYTFRPGSELGSEVGPSRGSASGQQQYTGSMRPNSGPGTLALTLALFAPENVL